LRHRRRAPTGRAWCLAVGCAGSSKWWDGYDGERGVLIDDYSGDWPISYLLRVLHEHPQKIEYKGGMAELAAKFFIITSNLHPDSWYPNADLPHQQALKRRITRIVWMDQPYAPIKLEADDNANSNIIDISDDE